MTEGQNVELVFVGEHKPTGARVELRARWDGNETTRIDDNRCPLCGGGVGFFVHANVSISRSSFRSAAQCASCKSWFEEPGTPGHVSHEPLRITFE